LLRRGRQEAIERDTVQHMAMDGPMVVVRRDVDGGDPAGG